MPAELPLSPGLTEELAAEPQPLATATRALNLDAPFARDGIPNSNLDVAKVTKQSTGGTSVAWLTARLKKIGRDDLLEQIGPGKPYRSTHAAAIEAGIIKQPPPTVYLPDDMEKVAANLRRHLSQAQAIALATALTSQLKDGTLNPDTHTR